LDSDLFLHKPSALPDAELLLQLHHGSSEAFTLIYNTHQPRIQHYLLPFVTPGAIAVDEIVQEVFVRLWMRRKDLQHVVSLEAYLKKMARNHLLNIVKAQRIKERHEVQAAASRVGSIDDVENDYRFKEYYQLTRKALDLLPERRRYLFQLSTVEGYSLDEIAAKTNLSKTVIKKQLTLTNQFLRRYLQEKGGFRMDAGIILLCCLLTELK